MVWEGSADRAAPQLAWLTWGARLGGSLAAHLGGGTAPPGGTAPGGKMPPASSGIPYVSL